MKQWFHEYICMVSAPICMVKEMSLKTNENQQKKKSSSALAYGGAIIASLGILVFLTLLMTNAFSGTGSNGSKVLLPGNSKVIN